MIKKSVRDDRVWVTFTLEKPKSDNVKIKGSWNDWKEDRMRKKKNGDFYVTRQFKRGNIYEFGYLLNGEWIVDEALPKTPSPFGSLNNILEI